MMSIPYTSVIFAVFKLTLLFQAVLSRPDGAPQSSCLNLKPSHGSELNGASPFLIHIGNESNVQLPVTLSSSDRTAFQGFVLQARDVQSNRILGSFSTVPIGTKAIHCSNEQDTVTHSDTVVKFDLGFSWTPPQNYEGKIFFLVTVSENYFDYWLRISSKEVTLSSNPQREPTTSPGFIPSEIPFTQPGTEQPPVTEIPTFVIPDTEVPTHTEPLTLPPTELPPQTELPTYIPPDTELPPGTEPPTYVIPNTEVPINTEPLTPKQLPPQTEFPTYVPPATELPTEPFRIPSTEFPTHMPPSTEFPTYILPDTEPPLKTEALTKPTTQSPPSTEFPTYILPDTEPPLKTEALTKPTTQSPPSTEFPTYILPDTEPPLKTEALTKPTTQSPPSTEFPTYILPDTEPPLKTEALTKPTTQSPPSTEFPTYIPQETKLPSEADSLTTPSETPTRLPPATELTPQSETTTHASTRSQRTTQNQGTIDKESTKMPPLTTFAGKIYSAELSIDGEFDVELNNKRSQKFKDFAATLKTQIENVYKEKNESVDVRVIQFRPNIKTIIVELALAFDMEMTRPLQPLQQAVKNGRLGRLAIIPNSIQLIGESGCILKPCHKNATCIPTSDSYMCRCNSGFTGDGTVCLAPMAAKQQKSKDDDMIKYLLIASLATIGIILLIVLFSLIILLHRIFQNSKSDVNN